MRNLLSTLLLSASLATSSVSACGGYYEDFLYPKYRFRITENKVLDYWYSSEKFAEANTKEWNQMFPSVAAKDIYDALYDRMNVVKWEQVAAGMEQGNASHTNLWVKEIIRKNDLATARYLAFAEKCQVHAQFVPDSWSDSQNRDSSAVKKLIADAENRYLAEQNPSLKIRYAYQCIRLAHYLGLHNEALAFYQQIQKDPASKGLLWQRIQRHVLAITARQNQTQEALKMAVALYGQDSLGKRYLSEDLQFLNFTSLVSGSLQNPDPAVSEFLLFAADVLQTKSRRELLIEAAKIAPDSPAAEKLIQSALDEFEFSAINDLTKWALVTQLEEPGFFGRIWKAIVQFFKELFGGKAAELKQMTLVEKPVALVEQAQSLAAAIERIAEQSKHPANAYTSIAYLKILCHEFADAGNFLEKAEKAAGNDATVIQQIQALKLLTDVASSASLDAGVFSKIEAFAGNNEQTALAEVRKSICNIAGQKFLYQEDYENALYAFMASERYDFQIIAEYLLSDESFAKVQNAIREGKYPYASLDPKRDRINLFKLAAVYRKLHQNQLAEAAKLAEQVSSDTKIYSNPDKNYYDQKFVPDQTYTIRDFFAKINQLETAAKNSPDPTEHYYRLANAFWTADELYFSEPAYGEFVNQIPASQSKLKEFLSSQNELSQCRKKALQYYLKVMESNQNPELAAKACLMCHQITEGNAFEDPTKQQKPKKYFDLLQKNYAQTNFFKTMLVSCPELKMYYSRSL